MGHPSMTSGFRPWQPPCVLSFLVRALILIGIGWRAMAEGQIPTVVDPTFGPGLAADNDIFALAIQPDGKILVGGQFTTFSGILRSRLVRLNTDGMLDPTFDIGSGANNDVYAIALQPDGKILIGGAFTAINGESKSNVARLHPNGAVDAGFAGLADNELRAIAVQPDGKIVIAGRFTSIAGAPRNRVARLNANGTLDSAFDPGPGANNNIRTLVRQADGKFLIGGQFTSVDETNRFYLARLNENGRLDDGFVPPLLNGTVRSIALMPRAAKNMAMAIMRSGFAVAIAVNTSTKVSTMNVLSCSPHGRV